MLPNALSALYTLLLDTPSLVHDGFGVTLKLKLKILFHFSNRLLILGV